MMHSLCPPITWYFSKPFSLNLETNNRLETCKNLSNQVFVWVFSVRKNTGRVEEEEGRKGSRLGARGS